ncbi:MAG TPA: flagellar basal body L-ring protein FlgH [Micropepsaceae bacterium]|nr:flagellar basal body L-ring protein FlgH [Micropepsaceae bacterium]
MRRLTLRVLSLAGAVLTLSACGAATRISEIGAVPPLSPIGNTQTMMTPDAMGGTASVVPAYQPAPQPVPQPEVRREPEPRPMTVAHHPNSLWAADARGFFKDQRASQVGDILTVNIRIEDKADIANTTERTRNNTEDADITNLFGAEAALGQLLPEEYAPETAVGLGSSSSTSGAGSVARAETIELTVAAVVVGVMPNGNLVIEGRQEVRVNFEVRELYIAGIVRPEDISNDNTISNDQIAEARISYGGRGQITEVQQPRYGQQLLDIILPF